MVITNKIHGLQKKFTAFAGPILTRISGLPVDEQGILHVGNDDAAVFNFVLKRKSPTHHTTPMQEVPGFGITPLGGAVVKFHVHPIHDSSRARKLPGMEIELRFHILGPDEKIPAEAEALAQHRISSRAIFILDCGKGSAGKTLYVSLRWVLIKHPSRNGPWSPVYRMPVA